MAQNQPALLLLAVALLLASGFCDTLDGVLARTISKQARSAVSLIRFWTGTLTLLHTQA